MAIVIALTYTLIADTSLGVITKLGSNVYLQVFAVNTNNHTLTSASVVPLALSASSGLGTFCMAVYDEQVQHTHSHYTPHTQHIFYTDTLAPLCVSLSPDCV